MVGGSNPTENYFALINKTVNDDRYTPENFKSALNSKPPGFVYGDPALLPQEIFERELFNAPGGAEFFLGELKFISNQAVDRISGTLGKITYGIPNAPPLSIIGMLDAFGANAASFADPNSPPEQLMNELPPLPAPTDFPAAWELKDRPRIERGWATAPYLHNGSVPTLYHLIAGKRPSTFFRGNTTYDQELVGYTWEADTTSNGRAFLYDTLLSGFANTGHSGPEFNGGIDWDAEPQKLWDLLEYLKTL
jgi:hypothetical protein